jgi:hypothetical protein
MKNTLNDYEIKKLVKTILESELEEQEIDEILGNTMVGNIYQGMRGLFKGEGYNYYRFLNKIKNRSNGIKKQLQDVNDFVIYLQELRPKIEKLSYIAAEKKARLLILVDLIIKQWTSFFSEFEDAVKQVNTLASEKLKGERLDVIPNLDKNVLGSDLMKSKDKKTEPPAGNNLLSNLRDAIGGNNTPTDDSKNKNNKKTDDDKDGKIEIPKDLKEEILRFKQIIK